MITIAAKITICRTTSNQREPFITIEITDELSRARFFKGEMLMEDYANAISGMSSQAITAEVFALDKVGKRRITEERSVLCPLKTHKREEFEQWLADNCQEEGWILNAYLGSQSSTKREGEQTRLNYSVVKFIEP